MNEKQTKTKNAKPSRGGESINWSIIEAEKRNFSPSWYAGMAIGFLALLAIAIFLIKSWSFAALLVISILALVVFLRRPARTIHYSLSSDGVSIDGLSRPFEDFKSFGVIANPSGNHRLVLIPIKRFFPAFEVDFEEKDGEKIVDFLGSRLPMQELAPNFIDNIIQRLGL